MAMNKYATYRVFKHKQTGELVRVAHTNDETEMTKVADLKDERCWIEMDADPDDDQKKKDA